ncbi:MAG: TrmH family RNA methyltransferase [Saprospiraceae bacterium]|nr:TrmH family RNA methyltransferase [Saprospiraceae bacterium]
MKKLSLEELGRHSVSEHQNKPKFPVKIVLDNIRSGINVGSAFRTADALLIDELILVGISPQPPHREILKSAIGAEESVPWRYFPTPEACLDYLEETGYALWVVEQTNASTSLLDFRATSQYPLALVFGNEVHGVSEAFLPHANGAIEIPQYGTKHSFNVSIAIGIVLWEIVRQIQAEPAG